MFALITYIFFYIFGFYRDSRTTVMNKDILLLFPNGNIIYYLLGSLGPIMIVCGLQTTPNLLNEGKGYYRLKKKKSYKNLIIFRYLNDLLHISLTRGSTGMPRMRGKSVHTIFFFLWILILYDLKTSDHEKSYMR